MENKSQHTQDFISSVRKQIQFLAAENHFELVGFTEAKLPLQDRENIQSFIENKFYASMDWFPERQSIRMDFENLGFTVNSCIVLGSVYYPTNESTDAMVQWEDRISKYAWGQDYHDVLKNKARPIIEYLRRTFPESKFRQAVDSLPIPEKILARQAGLGWIGKNTLLLNSSLGSYFFLTVILCENNLLFESNLENTSDPDSILGMSKDRCGTCTACIDACPTQAIVAPYQLDANLCISHHTIETKGEYTTDLPTKNWIYGCDICQDVCPWNRVSARKKNVKTQIREYSPLMILEKTKSIQDLLAISEEKFIEEFKNSPILRTGWKNLNRNINHVISNRE
ncbi:tRNA epoxyqueuosine(34) reductase QueG [Leptospira sp. GIMC2001]|uniref:tRNA epoxyqueuosine(34) reductase QueG n=1 Tax=Leptospira sp. GIMC2001 TaxID=1513297 RepID=UPI00234A856E|nr:tRNA epoxyqueuosine(34) reductase QueG [Leptospira sp. GIMC2001]WCL50208.1 tRNA epoxyqueuosine(34) reductase QueG [Leptospira sp. GIMC2001]